MIEKPDSGTEPWQRTTQRGHLTIWQNTTAGMFATVELYKRQHSHWDALRATVLQHGDRGPVMQITGPLDASDSTCWTVFAISVPVTATVAAASLDIETRSALVQVHALRPEWLNTEHSSLLTEAHRIALDLAVQSDQRSSV